MAIERERDKKNKNMVHSKEHNSSVKTLKSKQSTQCLRRIQNNDPQETQQDIENIMRQFSEIRETIHDINIGVRNSARKLR